MMTTVVAKHFDVLDYVDKSKALGVDEKVAKYQARQIEQAIDIAVNTARTDIENKELATKSDIHTLRSEMQAVRSEMQALRSEMEAQIHKSKFEIVIWMGGLLIASGFIQHFFK
ncbi:MAG: hypothetical protein KBD83_04940 [Gammaproteobacteria bacterium]|nr:hypothetical protein [Gammaproteobacteria bacterium]